MDRRLRVLAVFGCMAAMVLVFSGIAWAQTTPDAPYACGGDNPSLPTPGKKPRVTDENPSNLCVIADATPTVRATVTDPDSNLAKKNIRFLFDGVGKTDFTYNRRTDRLEWVSSAVVADGAHTVRVVAQDNSRKTGSKAWAFTVGTPPDTAIDSGPEGTVANNSASFSFSSPKAGSTFECSLDNSDFAPCTSPEGYSALSQGDHDFGVRAVDGAGNVDATPANRSWTVDTIAPTVTNISPAEAATGVDPGSNVTATFPEAMNSSSISGQSFTLVEQGSSSAVGAVVSYDSAARKATLDPNSNLTPNTTYTASLTVGVKELAGNAVAQERSWTFTTGPAGVNSAPSTLNLSPTDVLGCTRGQILTVTNNSPNDVTFAEFRGLHVLTCAFQNTKKPALTFRAVLGDGSPQIQLERPTAR